MAHCRWAPSGRHILTISDFKLRLTLWSLVDQSVQYIPCPKHADTGIDFSSDGGLMAVILKAQDDIIADDGSDNGSDVIGLYNTRS